MSTESTAVLAPNVTVIPAIQTRLMAEEQLEPEKLRVAAYARVSTEQDAQQNSYEAQVEHFTRYIQTHPNWEFIGVFSDPGVSGTSLKHREGFNKMIDCAMNGGIDLILTKSISRFARNTVDTLSTVRKLKEKGVEVIFEKEHLHSLDQKCEMVLTIFSSLAQEESRSISENVRWGKQKSMRDGTVYMLYGHFLGYRKGEDGQPEIVEKEAAIVREIYDRFLNGESISQIADYLTAKGIPTPSGKQKWCVSTVKSILTNERYKGDAILQKTYTVDYLTKEVQKNNGERTRHEVTNSHEPIIALEVHERVQRELIRRRTARPKRAGVDSPFMNRLVCADCGGCFGHKVWRSGGKNRNRYDVWYCNRRYEGEPRCHSPTLREKEIKAAFERVLKKLKRSEQEYSEALWRDLVETVTISAERKAKFLLTDGQEVEVTI